MSDTDQTPGRRPEDLVQKWYAGSMHSLKVGFLWTIGITFITIGPEFLPFGKKPDEFTRNALAVFYATMLFQAILVLARARRERKEFRKSALSDRVAQATKALKVATDLIEELNGEVEAQAAVLDVMKSAIASSEKAFSKARKMQRLEEEAIEPLFEQINRLAQARLEILEKTPDVGNGRLLQ